MKIIRTLVPIVAAGALLSGVSACSPGDDQQDQYQGVCVDPNTNVRLDDSQCAGNGGRGDGTHALLEYMLLSQALNGSSGYTGYVPAVGYHLNGAVRDYPHTTNVTVIHTHVPKNGGWATFRDGKALASSSRPAVAKSSSGFSGFRQAARSYSSSSNGKSGYGGFSSSSRAGSGFSSSSRGYSSFKSRP